MRYARIISKLYGEPLLLEPNAWHAFDHALRNLMGGSAPNAFGDDAKKSGEAAIQLPGPTPSPDDNPANDPEDEPLEPRVAAILEIDGATAIITLDGVIDKHVSMFELQCYGGVDLDDIDAALALVAADDSIQNVLLVFNSPGGSVIGVPETAAKVAALGKIKNVKAFSDSMCCSGAIYIASQAGEFFVTQSTYSGSIGVICGPFLDFSKAMEMQGIKAVTIKSGKYKDTGSPQQK